MAYQARRLVTGLFDSPGEPDSYLRTLPALLCCYPYPFFTPQTGETVCGRSPQMGTDWYNWFGLFLDDTSSHHGPLPQHEPRRGPWGRVLMELPNHYRFQHRHILGKTGTGKSTLLRAMMLDDLARGDGLFYVDPHGEDADRLIDHIPPARRADTILFDPSDDENVCPINLLADVAPDWRPFVASSLVDTFKSIWGYDMLATPVMDQYLYNSVAALLEAPDATLMDIRFMLTSQNFRDRTIDHKLRLTQEIDLTGSILF